MSDSISNYLSKYEFLLYVLVMLLIMFVGGLIIIRLCCCVCCSKENSSENSKNKCSRTEMTDEGNRKIYPQLDLINNDIYIPYNESVMSMYPNFQEDINKPIINPYTNRDNINQHPILNPYDNREIQ